MVTVDSELAFGPGELIATSDWATGGEDIDNIGDLGWFVMRAEARVVVDTGSEFLTSKLATDTKLLNPEPVPEPAAMGILVLGLLAILRRR